MLYRTVPVWLGGCAERPQAQLNLGNLYARLGRVREADAALS